MERWIWMFVVIASLPVPPAFVHYCQDQLMAFVNAFVAGEGQVPVIPALSSLWWASPGN